MGNRDRAMEKNVNDVITPIMRSTARLATLAFAIAATAAGASAQPGPPGPPPPVPSYASQAEPSIRGIVTRIDGKYQIHVRDVNGYIDNVSLHPGTIINPTGLPLAPGERVSILGQPAQGVFVANEIDVPALAVVRPYGCCYPYRAWGGGFGYGYRRWGGYGWW